MGRPSKLDSRQRAEIGRRLALGGDGNTVTELAREFRVSKGLVSSLFSKRSETIKSLATVLATTEAEIERLPVSEQCSVRTLADQLKDITTNAANGASHGMRGSSRLLELYAKKVSTLDEDATPDDLRAVAAMAETANRGASLGLSLMQANKGSTESAAKTLEELVSEARRSA